MLQVRVHDLHILHRHPRHLAQLGRHLAPTTRPEPPPRLPHAIGRRGLLEQWRTKDVPLLARRDKLLLHGLQVPLLALELFGLGVQLQVALRLGQRHARAAVALHEHGPQTRVHLKVRDVARA